MGSSEDQNEQRRQYDRLAEKHFVECYVIPPDSIGTVEAEIKDFSGGGMLLVCRIPYEKGDKLHVKFTVEGLRKFLPVFYKEEALTVSDPVKVFTTVQRVKVIQTGYVYEVAVKFDEIDGADKTGLINYIKNKK